LERRRGGLVFVFDIQRYADFTAFAVNFITKLLEYRFKSMVVIAHKIIREFALEHSDAFEALEDWYKKTCKAEWRTLTDVRETFGYADYVGNDRIAFNIRGNHYRLIALVIFKKRTVFIRFIGTHEAYDKIDASQL
jgi:mRNA interferase HigB